MQFQRNNSNRSFANDERIIPVSCYIKWLFTETSSMGRKGQARIFENARLKEILNGQVDSINNLTKNFAEVAHFQGLVLTLECFLTLKFNLS